MHKYNQDQHFYETLCANGNVLVMICINPYLANGFPHHNQLGEFTFIFMGVRSDFNFQSHFSMNFLCANRIALYGTQRSAASHLGLCCLPLSHKRDARLK